MGDTEKKTKMDDYIARARRRSWTDAINADDKNAPITRVFLAGPRCPHYRSKQPKQRGQSVDHTYGQTARYLLLKAPSVRERWPLFFCVKINSVL